LKGRRAGVSTTPLLLMDAFITIPPIFFLRSGRWRPAGGDVQAGQPDARRMMVT
jgi:hypothetical protein